MEKFLAEVDAKLDWLAQDTIRYLNNLEDWWKKYDQCQPRVPAGNPGGGQWASPPRGVPLCGGGIGINYPLVEEGKPNFSEFDEVVDDQAEPIAGKGEVAFVSRIADQYGNVPDQVNIFIGGAGDQDVNGNVQNSFSLNRYSVGDNYYFTNDSEKSVIAFIKDNVPKDIEVNVTGHSWGGDTAAKVALALPNRVNKLITIDPVTTFSDLPKLEKLSDVTNEWVNVNALNSNGPSLGDILNGNLVAAFGGWDDRPDGLADIHIDASREHSEFDAMMFTTGNDGRSPQDILNGIQPIDALVDQILRGGR